MVLRVLEDGTEFDFMGGRKYQMLIRYVVDGQEVITCEPLLFTGILGKTLTFFTEKCKPGPIDLISVLGDDVVASSFPK
jgi:hypothetical protein